MTARGRLVKRRVQRLVGMLICGSGLAVLVSQALERVLR